jgi:hypothetical protein
MLHVSALSQAIIRHVNAKIVVLLDDFYIDMLDDGRRKGPKPAAYM